MTAPIGLFYGSSTCYTEIAAEKIRELMGWEKVDVFDIASTPVSHMANYRYLILGIPTWDYGELQEDWEAVWDDLDDLDLSGIRVALYGLGDQEGYPQWFQDALGFLWAKVVNQGATAVGQWPVTGYRFEGSRALTADGRHFVGLALDEESEFELSEGRLEHWCRQVLVEFGLES